MIIDLMKSEIRCDCGALIYDGLFHKSYEVEMVNGEKVCPVCGTEETTIHI